VRYLLVGGTRQRCAEKQDDNEYEYDLYPCGCQFVSELSHRWQMRLVIEAIANFLKVYLTCFTEQSAQRIGEIDIGILCTIQCW